MRLNAFIHIPKTGGTYLGSMLVGQVFTYGHFSVVDSYDEYNPVYYPYNNPLEPARIHSTVMKQFHVFTCVRNIFSWLVSWMHHSAGLTPGYPVPENERTEDSLWALKGFDYMVKAIAERDHGPTKGLNKWPNRRFIFCQLFTPSGSFVPDFIIRQETLDDDLKLLCEKEGLKYSKGPRVRVSKYQDYRNYYTTELIDLVYKTWGRELELYGYDFDGFSKSGAVVGREVPAELKRKIGYEIEQDYFYYDIDGLTGPLG